VYAILPHSLVLRDVFATKFAIFLYDDSYGQQNNADGYGNNGYDDYFEHSI
jgi:hypothetical protein